MPEVNLSKPFFVTKRGDVHDGHHTFQELYAYRRAYNAMLFNLWASLGLYEVHKSKKHSDGKKCFGGKFFVVVAQLPTGQITNHYKLAHWDEFSVPERETAAEYDGHSAHTALKRMQDFVNGKVTP